VISSAHPFLAQGRAIGNTSNKVCLILAERYHGHEMRSIVEDGKRNGKESIDYREWICRVGMDTVTIYGIIMLVGCKYKHW
jgi:hypothetical protein